MKAHLLLVILVFGSCHSQNTNPCSLDSQEKINEPFPDLFSKVNFYQLSVEYTLPRQKESIYYTEYYDVGEKQGRLDIQDNRGRSKFYYYYSTLEGFEVQGITCKRKNISDTPEFMRSAPYGWNFDDGKRIVHGPSAMFRHAYLKYQEKNDDVKYMGETEETVRGFRTKYWKRCLMSTLSAEYYFMSKNYSEAFGLNLTAIPLRIYIYGVDTNMADIFLPQNYEFLNFLPAVTGGVDLFELPAGYGCTENRNQDDSPDFPPIPSFSDQNLMIYGEATYINKTKEKLPIYINTFMLALDINTVHMAYIYTPWNTNSDAGTSLEAAAPVMVVFDMKNKYVYLRDFSTDECVFRNDKSFPPRYYFPEGYGYVDLTDPALLFQNNEFTYLGEAMERGLKVNIFEAIFKNLSIGEKTVPETIATHYYLTPDEVLAGYNTVPQALIKIQMRFNEYIGTGDGAVKKPISELNINFYGFSTQIPYRNIIFDVKSCFKNSDQSMWITIGFPAEQDQIFKLKKFGPSVEDNVLGSLQRSTELTPIRSPQISVDYTDDSLLAIILILDRPPYQLDFTDIISDTTIMDANDVEGIDTVEGCVNKCLDGSSLCWGFALCGATCYIGNEGSNKTQTKKDCTFYKRTNFGGVPTMQSIARNIAREVELGQLKLMIPSGGEEPPIELTANFFEEYSPDESDELFNLMGKELNPRFRVLKVASKLDDKAGNLVKSFGQLSYAECQRICLDFKECETVSYCLGHNFQCLVSRTYGEEVPKDQIKDDFFCTILTRKYSDKFTRSPGNVLSQNAQKTLNLPNHEDCSRACVKETSFKCLSFDHCPSSKDQSCRLHTVHFLDQKTKEGAVTKEAICGHYSRKFSVDFKGEVNKKTLGNGFILSTNVTLEECAKGCVEYDGGKCTGFDYCQDSQISATSCFALTAKPSEMKTSDNPICNHYTRENFASVFAASSQFSKATAGGLGFLFFVIGGVLGAVLIFGIAYCRVNKSS